VRVLVDSSVIIAAIARPGVCAQFLDELVDGHTWLTSRYILDEVARKLQEKFRVPPDAVNDAIARIESLAKIVAPAAIPVAACRDPGDLPVLGAAVGGRADLAVSLDKDLLVLGTFQGMPIVRPGQAFHLLRTQS